MEFLPEALHPFLAPVVAEVLGLGRPSSIRTRGSRGGETIVHKDRQDAAVVKENSLDLE